MFVCELAVLNDEVPADISGLVAVAVPPEVVPHSILIVGQVEVTAFNLQTDWEIRLIKGTVQVEVTILYVNGPVRGVEGEN